MSIEWKQPYPPSPQLTTPLSPPVFRDKVEAILQDEKDERIKKLVAENIALRDEIRALKNLIKNISG